MGRRLPPLLGESFERLDEYLRKLQMKEEDDDSANKAAAARQDVVVTSLL
jgi:hypothetical protein